MSVTAAYDRSLTGYEPEFLSGQDDDPIGVDVSAAMLGYDREQITEGGPHARGFAVCPCKPG